MGKAHDKVMPQCKLLKRGMVNIENIDKKYIHQSQRKDAVFSANIDLYYRTKYPGDFRWDYLLQNNSTKRVNFAEVHEATSKGAVEVMRKFDWLQNMIFVVDSELNQYQVMKYCEYTWIRTGRNKLNPYTTAYKIMHQSAKYQCIRLVADLQI